MLHVRKFIAALVLTGAASAAITANLGCQTFADPDSDIYRNRMHVSGGALQRGTSMFSLKAVEAPQLGDPGRPIGSKVSDVNKLCAVGGTGAVFDLGGIAPDGSAIDPAWVDAFEAFMVQARWRRIGVIVRIPGAGLDGQDPAMRRQVVQAAADALKENRDALYWIDGPDAAELTRLFKRRAPRLTVLSEEGGDLRVVHEPPPAWRGRDVFVVGHMPPDTNATAHFLTPDMENPLAALDELHTNPAELAPWTPDQSLLSAEEREEGFINLFDGETLDGWWMTGRNKNGFAVEEGEIRWVERGAGLLLTRDRYSDFVLRLEWKIWEGGNSGVFIRAPRAGRASKIGMELQVFGDHGQPPTRHSSAAIYDVVVPAVNASRPNGEWNEMEVTADGALVRVVLNGVEVINENLDENEELKYRLREGFIGLQDHNSPVAFRNIRIKPL